MTSAGTRRWRSRRSGDEEVIDQHVRHQQVRDQG